jgi:hypothetical protein
MLAGLSAVALAEGEAGGCQVVVRDEEPHARAGGNSEDFVEVVRRAAGEEGKGKIVDAGGATKIVDSQIEVRSSLIRTGGVGAA